MSSTAAAAASGLAGGAWFGELASALQGSWQEVAASGEHRPRQQHKLGGGLGENNKMAAVGAAAHAGNRTAATKEEDVVACGGAISDATLYLLLDRFTPS
ncbi:hypothetical protein EJB05_00656, partial [Eragrostis curvula]